MPSVIPHSSGLISREKCFMFTKSCHVTIEYIALRYLYFVDNKGTFTSIGGFHVTSLPPSWWTKTKDFSVAS